MPDTAAVETALVARLTGDTGAGGLMTLMTDGVYVDVAKKGCTKFVIVSRVTHHDDYAFDGAAFEEGLYLIKAVDLNTARTRANSAAARIRTLLQDVTLTITGYHNVLTSRDEAVSYTEVDDENKDIRWQHVGGRYAVWVSP